MLPIATPAPFRQMKLRPIMLGWSMLTNTPTRDSGRPHATSRSQVSEMN